MRQSLCLPSLCRQTNKKGGPHQRPDPSQPVHPPLFEGSIGDTLRASAMIQPSGRALLRHRHGRRPFGFLAVCQRSPITNVTEFTAACQKIASLWMKKSYPTCIDALRKAGWNPQAFDFYWNTCLLVIPMRNNNASKATRDFRCSARSRSEAILRNTPSA